MLRAVIGAAAPAMALADGAGAQEDRPSRCCRTIDDVAAIRCPVRSADRPRAPAGFDPSASSCGSAAADRPRTDRAEAPATIVRPAGRRPIGADGEAASLTGEVGRSMHRLRSPRSDSPGTAPACGHARILVEHLDRLAPGSCLRGVYLAKIQHMPLHHTAIIETPVLNDAPVAVCLAVLLSLGAAQKHDAPNLPAPSSAWESGRSSLQTFAAQNDNVIPCRSTT
jgi:hypothetical protein